LNQSKPKFCIGEVVRVNKKDKTFISEVLDVLDYSIIDVKGIIGNDLFYIVSGFFDAMPNKNFNCFPIIFPENQLKKATKAEKFLYYMRTDERPMLVEKDEY